MRRGALLNLALLAAVLALAALLWFGEDASEEAAPRLTDLDRETVRRIEIEPAGGERIVLERGATGWRMTAPVAVAADDFAVGRLLVLLAEPVSSPLPDGPAELARFGLDDPAAVLRFDGARIALGGTNPLRSRRYVQTGEGVFLVTDAHLFALDRGYPGLVDTRLLPAGTDPVAIHLPDLVLRREGDAWTATATDPGAPPPPGDAAALARAWERASALRVGRRAAADAGDAPRLGIETAAGERFELVLREREPELVLERPDLGIAYFLAASQAERLLALPEPESPDAPAD